MAAAISARNRRASPCDALPTRDGWNMRRLMMLGILAAGTLGAPLAGAETLTVASRPVADEKAVFATVESISVVPARGRIGGIVVQLNVREGDPVDDAARRSQRSATKSSRLQMKSLDAQIDALQAQASQAQTDFTRIEGLVERGTLPRVKLDEARTALNVAENGLRARTAERAVIQQQLNEGQVLAPAGGRVLKKLVAVGSVVLPGDPVAMIARAEFQAAAAGAGTACPLPEGRRQDPRRRRRVRRAEPEIRRDRSGLSADRGRPRRSPMPRWRTSANISSATGSGSGSPAASGPPS